MTDGGAHETVRDELTSVAALIAPGATGVESLTRLGGGASQELWGFDLTGVGDGAGMVLRRAARGATGNGLPLSDEAEVMIRAHASGAPVPRVRYRFAPGGPLGEAYVMERISGETLPKRILSGPAFAAARDRAGADLGSALATIHGTPIDGLPLTRRTPEEAVTALAKRHAATGEDRPVFELALRRLARTAPDSVTEPPALVHGDFRLGNLMFSETALAAVLDWELAFIGDRHADLGWLCMESWRFGQEMPVAGLCPREVLIQAYEAAGGAPVDRARMDWWELWSALHWGIITREMAGWIFSGADRSVERHVIARRVSETELVLMAMMTGRAG